MKPPTTRYARSGECRIAYQVIGNGPIDLIFVPGFISNLELHWEDPGYCHLLRRLSTFARVIQFDKRGTGLSDRVDTHDCPSLETRMEDIRAVMDAAGSGRAVLLGPSEGGPTSILFAATYPERTRALVLYGTYAHFDSSVTNGNSVERLVATIERSWGSGASAFLFAPDQAMDHRFKEWWARYERLSVSPSAAIALARMNAATDVRSKLEAVRVPTLVIHRKEDARIGFAGGRQLARQISGAKFVALPGRDHPIWTGDVDLIADEIEEFLTGARPQADPNHTLAIVLVARICAVDQMGPPVDAGLWVERLEHIHRLAAGIIGRHRGNSILAENEHIYARFDAPIRAMHCALALRETAETLGLPLACALHAGEIAIRDDHASGKTIQITERIAALADPGDVLVSAVIRDLRGDSSPRFTERMIERIDGVEAPLRILALIPEQDIEPAPRKPRPPDLHVLTIREREVLALVADGLSNSGIARRLQLSDHTVKRHVANILLKLDLPTRAAAAAISARQ